MIQNTIHTIQTLTREYSDRLVHLRRDLHAYPELSGQEARTALILAGILAQLGLKVHMDRGTHGLWADLTTDPGQPCVALRVDMDALPITEINSVPYRSTNPGVMHACGHDVHAAIGVGVAAVLSHMRASLPGNVRFIFQPEEEEITGAYRMLRAGALKNPVPAAIFGLHVAPLPAGQIAWTDDLFLAGFAHYLVTLTPQAGAHSTPPNLNPLVQRCCRAIQRLNQWTLPETWPEMAAFWSLMQAGLPALKNFIIYDSSPDLEDPSAWYGQFGLGIKAATPNLQKAALGRVRAALNPLCQHAQTTYRIEPMGSMIDMRNHPGLVRTNLPALENALGAKQVIHLNAAFPFNCEDFAYYTKVVPGAMFWLGAANPQEGKYALLHAPDFDVDERCIETGTIAMATLIINTLSTITYGS